MRTVESPNYNLGFIAASLRPELARIVAEYYLAANDWEAAKARILAANALQARNPTSSARMEREFRHRLETLTPDQMSILVHATAEDRTAIAWLAVCKYVRFAYEFAAEVLREKLAAHDPVLRPSDYETFLDTKSVSNPELARLAPSSKGKVRRILLYMLVEAGFLVRGTALGIIQRPVLSTAVLRSIASDNPRWLAGFLVPDAEIASL